MEEETKAKWKDDAKDASNSCRQIHHIATSRVRDHFESALIGASLSLAGGPTRSEMRLGEVVEIDGLLWVGGGSDGGAVTPESRRRLGRLRFVLESASGLLERGERVDDEGEGG